MCWILHLNLDLAISYMVDSKRAVKLMRNYTFTTPQTLVAHKPFIVHVQCIQDPLKMLSANSAAVFIDWFYRYINGMHDSVFRTLKL